MFLMAASAAVAQETRIAAIVNDDVVSRSDLANRVQLVVRSSSIPDTQQNRERASSQVLRALIDEKLQMQEAKRLNVAVSQQEIDDALGRLEQQNKMPKGALDQYLTQIGIPRATLVDQITASLAWGKLVRNRLLQDVTVSDEEVEEALAHFKENVDVPQNRVIEIFLAIDNPNQEGEVKRVADQLIDQIRNGVNFSSVAQQFSQSPTAAVGGDLGWVTLNQLAPAAADAIQKMKPGEMSYPVRTPAGYYILYLVDRKILGKPNPGETVLSLVQVALPVHPTATADEQQQVMAQAQEISNTAKSCGELAKIGRDRAPQTSRELPEVRVADLPVEIRQVALGLGIAEASKPVQVPGAIGVLMVCQRKDPPGGLPSRDDIVESLRRERLDVLARRYLRDLRRGAYVDIRG
jgi:peptidyl-prolyl cis-trans isomerase SurA